MRAYAFRPTSQIEGGKRDTSVESRTFSEVPSPGRNESLISIGFNKILTHIRALGARRRGTYRYRYVRTCTVHIRSALSPAGHLAHHAMPISNTIHVD